MPLGGLFPYRDVDNPVLRSMKRIFEALNDQVNSAEGAIVRGVRAGFDKGRTAVVGKPDTKISPGQRQDFAMHRAFSEKAARAVGVPVARALGYGNEVVGGALAKASGDEFVGPRGFDPADLQANEEGFAKAQKDNATPLLRLARYLSRRGSRFVDKGGGFSPPRG